jgi:type IV secretion system protein VirB6
MDIQVAQTLFDSVDASLKTLLSGGTTKVMVALGGIFGTFWLLSFTLRGIQWLYMGMTAAFKDIVFEIAKMAFIAAMAFNVGWFIDTIVPFVTDFPTWMGGIMSGQEGNQRNQVDTLMNAYIDGFIKLAKAANFSFWDSNLTEFLLGIVGASVYLLGGVPFMLVAVGTMITLKVAVTIMLSVGPLFIAFMLFDPTRQWFFGWVSLIAGFMLTQVLFSVVLALEISFINTQIIKGGAIDTSLSNCFAMLVYFASFTVLATELPNYAASAMGGASAGGVTGVGGILGKTAGLSTARKMGGAAAKYLKGKMGNNIK